MSGDNPVVPLHHGRRGTACPDEERFLKEIDSLSHIFCLDPLNTPPRRRILPASENDDRRMAVSAGRYRRLPPAEPKSSKKEKGIWNWNPIRALSHFGHRRFDCRFSLHVHSIQGLPPDLAGASLAIRWRRISEPAASAQSTRSVQVVQGAAEFKETLYYRCSVYGARSGPAGSAKYEPRQFVISTTVGGVGATEVQLGRHLVDFALLLPQDLNELQEADCEGNGKWTKTFRLSGKAKVASLKMSFGFSLVGDGSRESAPPEGSVPEIMDSGDGRPEEVGRDGCVAPAGSQVPRHEMPGSLEPSGRELKPEDSATNELNAKLEALNGDEVSKLKGLTKLGSIIQEPCIGKSLDGEEASAEDKHCLLQQPDKESKEKSFDQIEQMVNEKEIKVIYSDELPESNSETPVCQEHDEKEELGKEHEFDWQLESWSTDSNVEDSRSKQEVPAIDIMPISRSSGGFSFFPEMEELLDKKPTQTEELTKIDAKFSYTESMKGDQLQIPSFGSFSLCETREPELINKQSTRTELLIYTDAKTSYTENVKSDQFPMSSFGSFSFRDMKEMELFDDQSKQTEEPINIDDAQSSYTESMMSDKKTISSSESFSFHGMKEIEMLEKQSMKFEESINTDANANPSYSESLKSSPLIADDIRNSVISELLNSLGSKQNPIQPSFEHVIESPREQLLKEFEQEFLLNYGDYSIFGIRTETKESDSPQDTLDNIDCSSNVQGVEAKLQNEMQNTNRISRAKMLETAETEALMRRSSLNEKVFQFSSQRNDQFGSPTDLPFEEPMELPPLGEGLGPLIQMKDGGFLRSMNPSLLKNSNGYGSLIMQVSCPVVVPAEMGSGVMAILQNMASMGIEKLSIQASKLMPLEDIAGKTLQQVAWEATPALEDNKRHLVNHQFSDTHLSSSDSYSIMRNRGECLTQYSRTARKMSLEYVSLNDLAPLAMDKIEALSIEGMRIQAGMSDKEAPSTISPQPTKTFSASVDRRSQTISPLGLEGTPGLKLLDIKDDEEVIDGPMGLCITLNDWMKLDSGMLDDENEMNEQTLKILAAHQLNIALIREMWKGGKRGRKKKGKRWGFMGNNFTVALMVQLRDPLRDFEPVGTPMLALVQVERVFMTLKPKLNSLIFNKGNSEQDVIEYESKKIVAKEEKYEEEEVIPQFKITEVNVAGIKTEHSKRNIWGNSKHQQSGSRWLLSAGMGKSNKHPLMKSKAIENSSQVTATVQPGDTIWSISSRFHGTGAKWKELAALNPHIRNPNIIFPNQNIRL